MNKYMLSLAVLCLFAGAATSSPTAHAGTPEVFVISDPKPVVSIPTAVRRVSGPPAPVSDLSTQLKAQLEQKRKDLQAAQAEVLPKKQSLDALDGALVSLHNVVKKDEDPHFIAVIDGAVRADQTKHPTHADVYILKVRGTKISLTPFTKQTHVLSADSEGPDTYDVWLTPRKNADNEGFVWEFSGSRSNGALKHTQVGGYLSLLNGNFIVGQMGKPISQKGVWSQIAITPLTPFEQKLVKTDKDPDPIEAPAAPTDEEPIAEVPTKPEVAVDPIPEELEQPGAPPIKGPKETIPPVDEEPVIEVPAKPEVAVDPIPEELEQPGAPPIKGPKETIPPVDEEPVVEVPAKPEVAVDPIPEELEEPEQLR